MSQKLVHRWAVLVLIAGLIILPVFIAMIWGVSALLASMGDIRGGVVLKYVALGAGLLWGTDLICLVLVQGLNSLTETDDTTPDT